MFAKQFNPWEVWYAEFPFEDIEGKCSGRPVIVLSATNHTVLVVKVTCHSRRSADKFDIPLRFWDYAHLNYPSVARVSKTIELTPDKLMKKIGTLCSSDAFSVFNAYRQLLLAER